MIANLCIRHLFKKVNRKLENIFFYAHILIYNNWIKNDKVVLLKNLFIILLPETSALFIDFIPSTIHMKLSTPKKP